MADSGCLRICGGVGVGLTAASFFGGAGMIF